MITESAEITTDIAGFALRIGDGLYITFHALFLARELSQHRIYVVTVVKRHRSSLLFDFGLHVSIWEGIDTAHNLEAETLFLTTL